MKSDIKLQIKKERIELHQITNQKTKEILKKLDDTRGKFTALLSLYEMTANSLQDILNNISVCKSKDEVMTQIKALRTLQTYVNGEVV